MPSGHKPYRHSLPPERAAITTKFSIAGHEGYITIGLFPPEESEKNSDGEKGSPHPGEIFITMSKEGSTVSGLTHVIAKLMSLCFQYNVPLDVLYDLLMGDRYEPSGITTNPEIPHATSITDYVVRFLKLKFCESEKENDLTESFKVKDAEGREPKG